MQHYLVTQSLARSCRLIGLFFILTVAACTTTQQSQPLANMHPSWDADGDGLNDCEQDGSCDHTVDYRQARPLSRPSFDCSSAQRSRVEKLICYSPKLAMLDVKLAKVFKQALAASKEPSPGPSFLKTEQGGWLRGRSDCWTSDNVSQCVSALYSRRIAQLQARYRLVASQGPVRYQCSDAPADELVVTYFDTDPAILISERGDRVALMYQTPSASGSRYVGQNESFWQHQGEATLEWGVDKAVLHCQQVSADVG